MTAQPHELARVKTWLTSLVAVTRPGKEDAKPDAETVALYTTMLADKVPSGAFTTSSLQYVAQESPFWPAYADLLDRLRGWWEANGPVIAPRLTHDSELKAEDQRWFAFYHKRRAEILDQTGKSQHAIAHQVETLASLVRGKSPAAWKVIHGDPGVVQLDQAARDAVLERFRNQAPVNLRSRPAPDAPPPKTKFEADIERMDAMTPEERATWRKARGLRVA